MSIVAYTGLPGSGKSYSVVEHQIVPALKLGRTVVTNIPLNMEAVDALGLTGTVVDFPVSTIEGEPHRIREYVVAGCVFVLDEAWRLFPQGVPASQVPAEYKSLMAEHRHMVDDAGNSTQIILVVQDLSLIGAFARKLVEETFVTTKLGHVGLNKAFRVDVFLGGQTGARPPVKARLRFLTGRYKKEIYSLYKSQTMAASENGGHGNEMKVDGRANIWKRPSMIAGMVLCPLVIWWSLHMFNKAFHNFGGPLKPKANTEAPGTVPRSSAERAVPGGLAGLSREKAAPLIRVLLEVQRGGVDSAYLSDGDRVVELDHGECRRLRRHLQCLFRGAYYDSFGFVESAAVGPLRVGGALAAR